MFTLIPFLLVAFAFYDKSGPVKTLTANNFDKVVLKSNVPVLTEFFAPWCGHCKALKPIYETIARNSKCIKLAAIDCDEEKAQCGKFGIKGFPTLKLWKTIYKNGKKKRFSVDYNGDRSESDLNKFIISSLTDAVKRVYINDKPKVIDDKKWLVKSLDEFYYDKNDTLSKAIFINKNCQVNPALKCLTLEFSKRIDFAVGCDDKLVEEYGTGLVVIPSDLISTKRKLSTTKFDGEFKDYDAVRKFLTKFKGNSKSKKNKDDKEEL